MAPSCVNHALIVQHQTPLVKIPPSKARDDVTFSRSGSGAALPLIHPFSQFSPFSFRQYIFFLFVSSLYRILGLSEDVVAVFLKLACSNNTMFLSDKRQNVCSIAFRSQGLKQSRPMVVWSQDDVFQIVSSLITGCCSLHTGSASGTAPWVSDGLHLHSYSRFRSHKFVVRHHKSLKFFVLFPPPSHLSHKWASHWQYPQQQCCIVQWVC